MSTETEPAPYMTIYHLTDACARCIAYRVVGHVLEQLGADGGDLEAALQRVVADQAAADGAWEATLAEWDRQGEETAEEFAAWQASVKDLPSAERQAASQRRLRERTGRFVWPPLDPT
jgi:hypothetical protein